MGRITVRGRGGGHKRRYRQVDFKRSSEQEYRVVRIEYDPNRSAHIALIQQNDGTSKADYSYILATDGLKAGDVVKSFLSSAPTPSPDATSKGKKYSSMPQELQDALARSSALQPGNVLPLKDMPLGQAIHSISLRPGGPAQLVRAAGASATVTAIGDRWVSVKLTSGEVRQINRNCTAVLGAVSNKLWANRSIGKAGRSRWLGRRPKVRGVAMNAFVPTLSAVARLISRTAWTTRTVVDGASQRATRRRGRRRVCSPRDSGPGDRCVGLLCVPRY
jgi:ribosomal protein L2